MKYPVLLPNIFDYPFTYESDIKLKAGDYVKVPFGKKNIIGVIWDFFEEKNNKEFKLKSIIEKIEIGISSGNKTSVIDGLKPGEQIFIDIPPWAKKRK